MYVRLFQTPLLLKNEECIDNKSIKGIKHLRIAMESLRRRLACKWIPQEESGIPQKEVHCIYV